MQCDTLQQHVNSKGIYEFNQEPGDESAQSSGDTALLTSALDGEWPIHASVHLLPERILKQAGWPAQPVWTGVAKKNHCHELNPSSPSRSLFAILKYSSNKIF
jgi:hypothetical protein